MRRRRPAAPIVTLPPEALILGAQREHHAPKLQQAASRSDVVAIPAGPTYHQATLERVANSNKPHNLFASHQSSTLLGHSQHQYPVDSLSACVTAIYLCTVLANSTLLDCSRLESLCNQQYTNHQRQPRDDRGLNDETSYLNPSSLEAALEELVAFAGGGEQQQQDQRYEVDKLLSKASHVHQVALRNGDQTNQTHKRVPGDGSGKLKLGTKLARRRQQSRTAIDEQAGKEQSFTSWIPRIIRSFNWDTLWLSSPGENDEEILADQPAQLFDKSEPPLEKDKFQILRPVDRNEPKNEANQSAYKLEQGLFASEPNSMRQDEDAPQKSLIEVKNGASSEALNKMLNGNKEFELSAANVMDSYLQQQRPQAPEKPQQQVLVPVRNECRCPSRPSDEMPLECRFSKCFPNESTDLKNDATLGQSSVVKPPLEVSFLHYTRYQRKAEYLDLSNESSIDPQTISFELFNVSLPVKVVIHGFGSGGRKTWVQEMVYKILDFEDVNVIVVDWEKGAVMPHYVQAAGNTKLVGQRLAILIQSLNARYGITPNSYHLIGFSLGAHVAGFAGAEIRNSTPSGSSHLWINRITGLDPASLLFEGYEPSERLDPSDAQFVDVIHSNGDGVLRGGFGAIQELGHVDFYPNGGRVQVGCNSVLLSALSDIIYGKWQSLCNHRRALNFFMDSFEYSKCRFKSFNCESYESYLKGECFDCGQRNEKCSYMGYFADLSLGRGRMYLTTHEEAPFCANQLAIKITGTRGYKSHWGKVEVTLKTFDGKNESFWLSSSSVNANGNGEQPGLSSIQHNMQSLVVTHSPLANFTQVLLRYTRYKGWIYSGNESWSIDKVLITDSDGLMKSYCGFSTILQSHIISRIDLESGNCREIFLEIPPDSTSSSYSTPKTNSIHQQKTSPVSPQDVQSRQAIVQPLMTSGQQESALSLPLQSHLGPKLTGVGYFPDRWQQQQHQHRLRQQQVTSFVTQFTTSNNMLRIKTI